MPVCNKTHTNSYQFIWMQMSANEFLLHFLVKYIYKYICGYKLVIEIPKKAVWFTEQEQKRFDALGHKTPIKDKVRALFLEYLEREEQRKTIWLLSKKKKK